MVHLLNDDFVEQCNYCDDCWSAHLSMVLVQWPNTVMMASEYRLKHLRLKFEYCLSIAVVHHADDHGSFSKALLRYDTKTNTKENKEKTVKMSFSTKSNKNRTFFGIISKISSSRNYKNFSRLNSVT